MMSSREHEQVALQAAVLLLVQVAVETEICLFFFIFPLSHFVPERCVRMITELPVKRSLSLWHHLYPISTSTWNGRVHEMHAA